MRCDQARPLLSVAFDGELADSDDLTDHLDGCAGCRSFGEHLALLRRALRVEPVGAPPDIAPRVLDRLRHQPKPRRQPRWAVIAATFLTAFLAGAVFIGVDPRHPLPVAAADLPSRILQAQEELHSVTAALRVIERGATERTLTGSLAYEAPESLALRLRQPGGPELAVVVDEERAWSSGPCGPACSEPAPPVAYEGREPFSAAVPAPLDLVLPVDGFWVDDPARPVRRGVVDSRSALGVRVLAAQLDALLSGLQQAGQLRAVHPTDNAELWLDEALLVPLRLRVTPAQTQERRLWAARNGYPDPSSVPILEVALTDVVINEAVPSSAFPAPPSRAQRRHAGFEPASSERVGAPVPAWLPSGMEAHRSGHVNTPKGPAVALRTWTDGRSWLRLRSTEQWWAPRLFGDLGEAVRPVDLGPVGTAYLAAGGRRLALHADGLDVELSGSVGEPDLRRVAASLGLVGQPVPPDWAEAAVATLPQAEAVLPGLLRPGGDGHLDGFAAPAVRVNGTTVTLTYAGPGSRVLVMTQAPGEHLSPPLEADVMGVEVRGHAGRYTPSGGELEWVEAGHVISVRSLGLGVEDLLSVAERLRRA